ncbi:MAG: hypothetical protein ACJAW3_001372 [Lentimonas sp.]|jgi:hypothetical protein
MIKRILLIIILAFIPVKSFSRENSGKLIIRKKFSDFTTSFESDYRYNESELGHRHYDLGIKIPFLESWSASINYRSVYKYKSKNNKWKLEKRPHISLQKNFNSKFVKFQLRTRQEYRYKADGSQSIRNRSRLMIKSNKAIFKLKPFIGNEIFYDMDENKYNKNWLVGGFSLPKSRLGNYSIYYKHVTDLNDQNQWNYDYSFVFKAVYEF